MTRSLVIFALILCYIGFIQAQESPITWVWTGGSNVSNHEGEYGELGTPSPYNLPGARIAATGWYDSFRRVLWVFGGYGVRGHLNDLWRYQVDENIWTWISGSNDYDQPGVYGEPGVANKTNVPGAREYATGWYDSSANELWLFGGRGYSSDPGQEIPTKLNDLWRYRVSDNTWTWMGGNDTTSLLPGIPGIYGEKGVADVTNMPGARSGAVGWFVNSTRELWLFGGEGYGVDDYLEGLLNDVWKYNLDNNTWTWMAGQNEGKVINSKRMVRANDDEPGHRSNAIGWYVESTHELWLFGGYGFVSPDASDRGLLNDMWVFNLNDITWTWISGSNTTDELGTYTKQDDTTTYNYPGSRKNAIGWYDSSLQELWMFGGFGFGDELDDGYLGDLWRFRIKDRTWAWMHANGTTDLIVLHGEKGVPHPDNFIGSRDSAIGWYDSTTRELCLFSGRVFPDEAPRKANDIWKTLLPGCPTGYLRVNGTCVPLIQCPSNQIDSGCSLVCPSNSCLIDGDLVIDGSILETPTLSIVSVVTVTGNVSLVNQVTLILSVGGVLNVEGCLLLNDNSRLVVRVDGEVNNGAILATYTCSSPDLLDRVSIELNSELDECRDGRAVVEQRENASGTKQLELLFVPSDSDACSSGSKVNIVAISIAVPIAVVVVALVIVIFAVPQIRTKIFPYRNTD